MLDMENIKVLSRLNISDLQVCQNGWSLLKYVFSNESEALKAIHNVIDKIEKQYEPGGSKYVKAQSVLQH